ncbi:MAG: purine-binding chemotaxis protein CheW [Zetaproteobacteria bacterium]|nr:purine-binding chemotaxis protein CheW [Zetaproteobacteria bacterium]
MKGNNLREALTFSVNKQKLCAPVSQVREVIPLPACTHIPLALGCIDGLISLRGHVITQIDMRQALKLPRRVDNSQSKILVTEIKSGEVVGIVVDEVGEVLILNHEDMESVPMSLEKCWRKIGKNVIKRKDELVVLVDMDALFMMTLPETLDLIHDM